MDPLRDRNVVRLARAVLGPAGVRLSRGGEYALPGGAALIYEDGAPVIVVSASAGFPRTFGLVAHELCEWRLDLRGYREPDRERMCNAQARGILAPEPAIVAAAHELGPSLRAHAERFGMSEVHMALRWAEAGGPPVAIRRQKRRLTVRDPRRQLPLPMELHRIFDAGGDAEHIVLGVSEPANTQVLVRVGRV